MAKTTKSAPNNKTAAVKPAARQSDKNTKQVALRSVQLAYENPQAEKAVATQTKPTQPATGEQTQTAPRAVVSSSSPAFDKSRSTLAKKKITAPKLKSAKAKPKKPEFGRMSEKSKRLTILAFQMAYEEHQGRSS